MFRAFMDCLRELVRSGYAIFGLVFTATGAVKDVGGVQEIPFPAWVWWLGAIACLFVVAVRLQLQLHGQEGNHVRRLRQKRYVTFREIADTLPLVHIAHSKEEIYSQLTTSVWNREWQSHGGYSRLHVTIVDIHGDVDPARPIVDGVNFLKMAAGSEPDDELTGRLIFQAALGPPTYSETIVGALTFEQHDFARWYRRFQAGRYEN
jgi:hypothetical protein